MITKQPTGETHYNGESALFIANADTWTSISWTAVSPDGTELDMDAFRGAFPGCTIAGDTTGSLTVGGLNAGMTGWSFYCTFYNYGATARTNAAPLRVLGPAAQVNTNAVAVKTCMVCGSAMPAAASVCPNCGTYVDDGTGNTGNVDVYANEYGAIVSRNGVDYYVDYDGNFNAVVNGEIVASGRIEDYLE